MMKTLILSLALLSLVSAAFGQSVILFEEDSITETFLEVDISGGFESFQQDLFYKNNTGTDISIDWKRVVGTNCPQAWDIISADINATYVPEVNESMIPIDLSPLDSHVAQVQLFRPNSVPGCCDVMVIFHLSDTPDLPIDTAYYHLEVNSPNCLPTAVTDIGQPAVRIFPNPARETISINYEGETGHLEILDINGRQLQRHAKFKGGTLDISSLEKGIYPLKLTAPSGRRWLGRFVKL